MEAVKIGSLSKIIFPKIPKNLTTLPKKSFVTEEALRDPPPAKQGIHLQYLVKWSIQIK